MNIEKLIEKLSNIYSTHDLVFNLLLSLIFILGLKIFKHWYIKKLPESLTLDERRKKLISFRNTTAFIIVTGLVILWASELKTFTLSLLAIAAALVIATKEVILASIGGLVRTTTKKYSVGDRVEVKGLRGQVIDITLLYTTVMEIGPNKYVHQYTGRTITFPNSLILSEPIHVDSLSDDCTTHTIQLPMYPEDADITEASKKLKDIADTVCEPYIELAKHYVDHIQSKTSIDMPSYMPRVLINVDDKGEWWLTLRVVIPSKEKIKIEQDIITKYIDSQKLLKKEKDTTK